MYPHGTKIKEEKIDLGVNEEDGKHYYDIATTWQFTEHETVALEDLQTQVSELQAKIDDIPQGAKLVQQETLNIIR